MTRLKSATFESGSVVASDGADLLAGTELAINATSPLIGARDVKLTPVAGNSYLSFASTLRSVDPDGCATLYGSFYVKLDALPTTDQRVLQVRRSTNALSIEIRGNGQLRLRDGSTSIGLTPDGLSLGVRYRIGFRYVAGTGANGILQTWVAVGHDPFGAPFASTTTSTQTIKVDEIRMGMTTAILLAGQLDHIELDNAVMPEPYAEPGGGGTTSVTATRSLAWAVRQEVTATRSASWTVRLTVAASRQVRWTVRQRIELIRAATWDVRERIAATRRASWNVRAIVSPTRQLVWSVASLVETTQVIATRVLSWDVRQRIEATRDAAWNVRARVAAGRVLRWDARQQVMTVRGLTWRVRAAVSASRSLSWGVRGRVAATRALLWNVASDLFNRARAVNRGTTTVSMSDHRTTTLNMTDHDTVAIDQEG